MERQGLLRNHEKVQLYLWNSHLLSIYHPSTKLACFLIHDATLRTYFHWHKNTKLMKKPAVIRISTYVRKCHHQLQGNKALFLLDEGGIRVVPFDSRDTISLVDVHPMGSGSLEACTENHRPFVIPWMSQEGSKWFRIIRLFQLPSGKVT